VIFKRIFPRQTICVLSLPLILYYSFPSSFGPVTFCILPLLSPSWLQNFSRHFPQIAKLCSFSLFSDASFKFTEEENIRVINYGLSCSNSFLYFMRHDADDYNNKAVMRRFIVLVFVLLYIKCKLHSQFPNPAQC
jgi:hypothetical protein